MAKAKQAEENVEMVSGLPAVDYWNTDLAKQQQAFEMAYRRATVALEALKLNAVSNEEAHPIIMAFIKPDCSE